MEIPKHIQERLTFSEGKNDHRLNARVVTVKPVDPCEACGIELEDTRRTKIALCSQPIEHWREYCYTCKMVSVLRENNFQGVAELNRHLARFGCQNTNKGKISS